MSKRHNAEPAHGPDDTGGYIANHPTVCVRCEQTITNLQPEERDGFQPAGLCLSCYESDKHERELIKWLNDTSQTPEQRAASLLAAHLAKTIYTPMPSQMDVDLEWYFGDQSRFESREDLERRWRRVRKALFAQQLRDAIAEFKSGF